MCFNTFASIKLRDPFRKLVRVCMMERWRDGDCTSLFLQGMDPSPPRIVIEEHSSVDEDHRSPASSPLPLTPSTHPGEEEEEEEGGASTFAKLVRTIQFIKRWAGRGERPPDPRDAFLDRFKVKSSVTCRSSVICRSSVTCLSLSFSHSIRWQLPTLMMPMSALGRVVEGEGR